ncbi:hypothetical protein PAPHI01_1563 [Pancytospora philotis]|nr:hypothetical protein PAPHI01_1546 [Pancytospora philotis]KAI4292289.1 hypothetical protein PAPHI01_1563 [Pancytospora philotis]
MRDEVINTVEFLKARSQEIAAMEKSLDVTHKTSLAWQRLPYYKRRRNRNYDKRMNKKFTHRPKDRHALRTHTFYAKRFFMLKVGAYSIPLRRRLKSAKFIYKSQARGFFFDESFRGAYCYSTADAKALCSKDKSCCLADVDFNAHSVVQYIGNRCEAIVDGDRLILIGEPLSIQPIETIDCSVSVLSKKELIFKDSQLYKIHSAVHPIETHKILCKRSEIMKLFEDLANAGLIPVCYEEIARLALENDCMTVYDEVSSPLYAAIENSINEEIVDKYNRTPASKKQAYDTSKLFLQAEPAGTYFIFRVPKGAAERAAEIYLNGMLVGHVVRSAYKFASGFCCGLGFFYEPGVADSCSAEGDLCVKNLAQTNAYPIEIIKFI